MIRSNRHDRDPLFGQGCSLHPCWTADKPPRRAEAPGDGHRDRLVELLDRHREGRGGAFALSFASAVPPGTAVSTGPARRGPGCVGRDQRSQLAARSIAAQTAWSSTGTGVVIFLMGQGERSVPTVFSADRSPRRPAHQRGCGRRYRLLDYLGCGVRVGWGEPPATARRRVVVIAANLSIPRLRRVYGARILRIPSLHRCSLSPAFGPAAGTLHATGVNPTVPVAFASVRRCEPLHTYQPRTLLRRVLASKGTPSNLLLA